MTYEITGCKDCLLFYDGSQYEYNHICIHPNAATEQEDFRSPTQIKLTSQVEKIESNGVEFDHTVITPITPDWCPLNQSPITIIKK